MATEMIINWLNKAYAMEQAQIKMLEQFSHHFESFAEVRSELRQHLLETKQQLQDIRECLDNLDAPLSVSKSTIGCVADLASSTAVGRTDDRLVSDLVVLHASEHYERATYLVLAEGARQAGEHEIADICERIAEEEAAMAEWVEEQIPAVVAACMADLGQVH